MRSTKHLFSPDEDFPSVITYCLPDFDAVDIAVRECAVRFLPAQDGVCTVVMEETERISHDVTLQEGALTIRLPEKKRLEEEKRRPSYPIQATVYLPRSTYRALTVSTVSGSVEIPGGFTFGTAKLKTVSGKIKVSSLKGDGAVSVESVSGSVILEQVSCASLAVHTVSGKIACSHVDVSGGEIQAVSVSGNLTLDLCDASTVQLQTVSGAVSGSLLRDTHFKVQTLSGKVSLPEESSTAQGLCVVQTTSGNVSFAGKDVR